MYKYALLWLLLVCPPLGWLGQVLQPVVGLSCARSRLGVFLLLVVVVRLLQYVRFE